MDDTVETIALFSICIKNKSQCGYETVRSVIILRLVVSVRCLFVLLFVICSLHCIAFLVFHDEILTSIFFGSGDST